MFFKVFNDNKFKIAEIEIKHMPEVTVSTHGCIGLDFDGAWYNLDYHTFELVTPITK